MTRSTREATVRWLRRVGIAACCVVAAFWVLPRVIPHQPLRERFATSTAVYDGDGGLLRLTLSPDEKYRVWVPLARMSPLLVDATLLQEDGHFWLHPGVDPLALVRGAWQTYVVRARRQGGSTITMQLALCYTKREILEAYLNLVPYGGNLEGAAAASLIYFGKDPSQLTVSEALTLAVLPQNPTRRAPGAGEGAGVALRAARAALYARWQAIHPRVEGEADLMQLAMQIGSPVDLPFRAPHLVNAVLAEAGGAPEVHTTLDRRLQGLLERQIRGYVAAQARLGVHNAAAMLVDARTMEAKALVGSADFFNKEIAGQV